MVLWLLVVLLVGKVLATSLTLSIGGSGGVFAPSLFTGAPAGMAFGICAEHIFGAGVGAPPCSRWSPWGGSSARRHRLR